MSAALIPDNQPCDNPYRDVPVEADKFDAPAFAQRIAARRKKLGLSLQQVADAAGITKPHVWALEQGASTNPSVNVIWGLAAALDVQPAELLGLVRRVG